MATWPSTVDNQERTRRLIDLFLVSVLLDAGAGTKWQYKSKESGKIYRRSEGLAVASLEMFKAGAFSSDPKEPYQVDSAGLKKLDVATVARGLQVNATNPIDGLEGRTGLLLRPDVPGGRRAWLSLLTGVALAEAVSAVAGVRASLKWPNGLLLRLAEALQNQEVFGLEARPGNMLGMHGHQVS